jgi:hypothetical protein
VASAARLLQTLEVTLAPLLVASLLTLGVADDFESGSLVSLDGGQQEQWDGLRTFRSGVTLRTSALAAHRGQLGLRLTDNSAATDGGCDPEAWVVRHLDDAGSGLCLRYWARQQFSGVGTVEIDFLSFTPDAGDNGSSGIAFHSPGGELQMGGYDRQRFLLTPVDAGLSPLGWHLLELCTTGIGTLDGGRAFFVDGRPLGAAGGLDFTTLALSHVALGENYSCPTSTTGTLDFDDVRTSQRPHASWLETSAAREVVQGACTPVGLALTDALGLPAPAPYDVEVGFSGVPLALFEDDGCKTPVSTLIVRAGEAGATHAFVATQAGAFLADVPLHADFLTRAPFTLDVSPPPHFAVGCGCESGGAGALAFLGWMLFGRALVRGPACRKGPSKTDRAPRRRT